MRRVVVGLASDSKSTILSDGAPRAELLELEFDDGALKGMISSGVQEVPEPASLQAGSFALGHLWLMDDITDGQPPTAESLIEPESFTEWAEKREPGSVSWVIVVFGPNGGTEMHRTSTVDLNLIVEGTVELVTEHGSATLAKGDCAIVPAAMHAWKAGVSGCTIICAAGGTAN
jgi:quercetin dioxygenase-like cupin family protein